MIRLWERAKQRGREEGGRAEGLFRLLAACGHIQHMVPEGDLVIHIHGQYVLSGITIGHIGQLHSFLSGLDLAKSGNFLHSVPVNYEVTNGSQETAL